MTDVLGPDVYHGNVDLVPAARIAADARFGFAVIKATEGVSYSWAESWFPQSWKAVGATRLVRGAYHFLIVDRSGKEQAEFYLRTIEANAGFRDADMHPIVDVEWKLNDGATKQQTVDCVEQYAETMHAEGHRVIRYGRSMFRDLGITTSTGCDFSWVPRYNDELGPTDDIGFPKPDLWQYGNGQFNFTAWPDGAPGMRPGDMNVVLTDLARLTIGGSAPPVAAATARSKGAGHRGTPASWSDEDWEALAAHLPRTSDDDDRVQDYILGQLDRRFSRPVPADQGPRRAGWKHEDDLIAVRKSLG
jgi:hypothetical protein